MWQALVPAAGSTTVDKTDKSPCFHGSYILEKPGKSMSRRMEWLTMQNVA